MAESRNGARSRVGEPEADGLELEIRRLIVDVARLPPAHVAEVAADARLFDVLGLDSLDGLQIASALRRRYGLTFGDDRDLSTELGSVRSIARLVKNGRRLP